MSQCREALDLLGKKNNGPGGASAGNVNRDGTSRQNSLEHPRRRLPRHDDYSKRRSAAADFGAATGDVHRATRVARRQVNSVVSVPGVARRAWQKEQRPRGRLRRQAQPRRSIAAGWSQPDDGTPPESCLSFGSCRGKRRWGSTSGRVPGAFTEPPAGNCRRLTAVVSAPPAITCRGQKEQRPRGRLHRQH